MAEHTVSPASPLPWHIERRRFVMDARGYNVLSTVREDDAYVLVACNAFPQLVESIRAFLDKWPAVIAAQQPIYTSAFVHGVTYQGPDISAEVEQLRSALRAIEERET